MKSNSSDLSFNKDLKEDSTIIIRLVKSLSNRHIAENLLDIDNCKEKPLFNRWPAKLLNALVVLHFIVYGNNTIKSIRSFCERLAGKAPNPRTVRKCKARECLQAFSSNPTPKEIREADSGIPIESYSNSNLSPGDFRSGEIVRDAVIALGDQLGIHLTKEMKLSATWEYELCIGEKNMNNKLEEATKAMMKKQYWEERGIDFPE